ncbi:MAG TPA: isocitrate/isopropylmalate family dehydrogenase, partial [Gemmataceae bacterium]|nr:isocitrate/isopropylmalate family dehydrogenase [Gemmataceae bacterium]
MHRVVFVQGGGIGLDQEAAVRRLLAAAGVEIEWQVFSAGWEAQSHGLPVLADEMIAAIRQAKIALKTKLLPAATGSSTYGQAANFNVLFRKALGVFAVVRPIHNLAGLASRFNNVNFTLVREVTEDLYATTEHEVAPGVVQSFKIVTATACLRFFRFAFELAVRQGRKSVHCIHKANILKLADGLALDCFRKIATEFPHMAAKEMIVDNACMQLVSRPHQFELVATGNLYGDLLSDLGAGLSGGIASTAGILHADGARVYEAIFGAHHGAIGRDKANPLPLILPALEMLKELGETAAATRIQQAVETVLTERKVLTTDLGGTARTSEFTDAVIRAMASEASV